MRLKKLQQELFLANQSPADDFAYINSLGPVAWFRAGEQITVTGSGVSQWGDITGLTHHLLQGTDANRPINLPYSGSRYLYLPGVAGNYASTPDPAATPTTDIDIRVQLSSDDWTPAAEKNIVTKDGNAAGAVSFAFNLLIGGELKLYWSPGGASFTASAASTVATGFTDGALRYVRVTFDADNGAGAYEVKFYTSTDGSSWAQLGTTVTGGATSSIFDSTAPIEVGSSRGGTTALILGKIYRASIYSTIGGSTPVVDFNAADGTDGAASFVSSTTGETWTVNTSGGKPAQIVGRSSILFDGAAHFLKCSAFTLNQPETVYILFKQVSWANNTYVYDGNTGGTMGLYRLTATPNMRIAAGASALDDNPGLAVGTYGVVAGVFNGASSAIQNNLSAAVTGDASAGNGGGFTLGAYGGNIAWSNIQVLECLIFPAAHGAATRARVANYLRLRGQVTF